METYEIERGDRQKGNVNAEAKGSHMLDSKATARAGLTLALQYYGHIKIANGTKYL